VLDARFGHVVIRKLRPIFGKPSPCLAVNGVLRLLCFMPALLSLSAIPRQGSSCRHGIFLKAHGDAKILRLLLSFQYDTSPRHRSRRSSESTTIGIRQRRMTAPPCQYLISQIAPSHPNTDTMDLTSWGHDVCNGSQAESLTWSKSGRH